jgi:hypothetical protein
MKYVYVKRHNGSVVDIPEKDLQATLKRNPAWRVVEEEKQVSPAKVQVICPLCSKEFKNENGLRLHKRSHE